MVGNALRAILIVIAGVGLLAVGLLVQQNLPNDESLTQLESLDWKKGSISIHSPSESISTKPASLVAKLPSDEKEQATKSEPTRIPSTDTAGTNTTQSDRLIDFAVIGFEKCGTTFLLKNIFQQSDQVYMVGGKSGREISRLDRQQLGELEDMFRPHFHRFTPEGLRIKTGFKNPIVPMIGRYLENLSVDFPTTKLIITVRHPVLWFQSWYNFKARMAHIDYPMPSPHDVMGLCDEACKYKGPSGRCIQVQSPGCSGHSYFHQYLSRLGYTAMDSEDEKELLGHHQMSIFDFSRTQLFLTEIGQLDGKNATVADALLRSMETFVGLETDALPDIEPYQVPSWKEDKPQTSIDICHDEYSDIRASLLDVGRKAGRWIEEYLLSSPDVFVADRQDLINRLCHWKVDPCKNMARSP